MQKKLKISATAYRVLLLLQKLNEKKLNIDELNRIFSQDPEVARFFSKDVILKYISTLRMAGYDISKPSASDDYCYVLNKAPVQIELSEEETQTLASLKNYALALQQKKFIKNYNLFIDKLKRYMPDENYKKLNGLLESSQNEEIIGKFQQYSELIRKIEQFITESQRVEIEYNCTREKQKKLVITKLYRLKYMANEVKVVYYELMAGQIESVRIEDIVNIKQLPTVSGEGQSLCPVIFKLKGRLAKTYRPYEREKVSEADAKTGEITVTTYSEDIDSLLYRLLKYGENCELLYPKQMRNKIKNLILEALSDHKT